MNTEVFVVNDSGNGEVVKDACELMPDFQVAIFPQTLIKESISNICVDREGIDEYVCVTCRHS